MANTGIESVDRSQHDPDFYFKDGNIVLSARGSKNHTTYFRLHESTLVRESPVFADMLTMPPPPTTDKYDGVPLVDMPDDVDALRVFIGLLCDPKYTSTILDDEEFTLKMLEPTRLAKKYQLRKQWPTSLAGWDSIAQDEADQWTRDEVGGEFGGPHWYDETLTLRKLPEPVSSIILARECDVPEILPFAFLHLFRLPLDVDPATPDFQPLPWALPERSLLFQDDLYRLALARERIGKWYSRHSEYNMWEDYGSGMGCEATTLRAWEKIAKDVGRDGNVLQVHRWTRDNLYLRDICPGCKDKLATEIHALREGFVLKLCTFFQLDDEA